MGAQYCSVPRALSLAWIPLPLWSHFTGRCSELMICYALGSSKTNFYFEIIFDLQENCKTSAKNACLATIHAHKCREPERWFRGLGACLCTQVSRRTRHWEWPQKQTNVLIILALLGSTPIMFSPELFESMLQTHCLFNL